MPKYNYTQVKVIKKRRKHFKKFNILIGILTLVAFTYFFADAFSNFLTVGNLSFSIFESGEEVNFKHKSLYALSLGKYTTKEEADEVANVAGNWGAAGYVVQLNGSFYVMGSVYTSRDDSENVRANLNLTNYNTENIELSFPKINIKIESLSKDDKTEIKKVLNFLYEIYNTVYDVSIKLDKGEITNVAGSSFLNTLKSEVKINNMNLNKINLSYNNETLHNLCNTFTQVEDSLDVCVNQLLSNSYVNRAVKYTLCEFVFLEYNLLNNL